MHSARPGRWMPVMLDATLVARWGIDEVVGGRWIIRVVGICGKWPFEQTKKPAFCARGFAWA